MLPVYFGFLIQEEEESLRAVIIRMDENGARDVHQQASLTTQEDAERVLTEYAQRNNVQNDLLLQIISAPPSRLPVGMTYPITDTNWAFTYFVIGKTALEESVFEKGFPTRDDAEKALAKLRDAKCYEHDQTHIHKL